MMKNFFRKTTTATPALNENTQKFAGKYSPQVLNNGVGFGIAWITKQLGLVPFEIADTNSMLPVFDYDHLLYCEPVDNDSVLKMYDVCVYEDLATPTLIVHRITKVNYVDNRFYFQGDNNLFGDGWVPKDRIKWRVVVISYSR